ncbi:hypothetical protein [Dongia sp.]|uniref:hypothetical protein n=1 Tax=Dongia sp. TaxID=1977262 RepID=UPI003753E554
MRGFLVTAVLCLAACTTTQQATDHLKSAWIGRSADDFVARYGIPKGQYRMQNGDNMLAWGDTANTLQTVSDGGHVDPESGIYVEDTTTVPREMSCDVQLTVSPNGMIKDVIITRDTVGKWNNSRCAEVFE